MSVNVIDATENYDDNTEIGIIDGSLKEKDLIKIADRIAKKYNVVCYLYQGQMIFEDIGEDEIAGYMF